MFTGARCMNSRNSSTTAAKDNPVAPSATELVTTCGQRRPKIPLTAAPSKGSSGMIQRWLRTNILMFVLKLEQVHAFDVERLPVAGNQNHNGQPDRSLRGRHHNHKKHEHLPSQISQHAAEGDERKIHGVEHQLDGHKHRDDVSLKQESHDTQPEEHRAQDDVIRNRDQVATPSLYCCPSPRRASTIAPNIAIKIRMLVSSNGKT